MDQIQEQHDQLAALWIGTCLIFHIVVMVLMPVISDGIRAVVRQILFPAVMGLFSVCCGIAYISLIYSWDGSNTTRTVAGVCQLACVWGILINDLYLTRLVTRKLDGPVGVAAVRQIVVSD